MTNVITNRRITGQLIVRSYASLVEQLRYAGPKRGARITRALCRLEERASYRRVQVEQNAEALPLDVSWDGP